MPAPKIPSTLTDRQRAQTVYNALQAIQLDKLTVETACDRAGGDADAPSGFYDSKNEPISCGDHAAELAKREKALVEKHADVMSEVEKIVEESRA